MGRLFASSFPRVRFLVGLSVVTSACGSQDLYREMGGMGNYLIVSHHVLANCGSEPESVPDARCIQVLRPNHRLLLQNCNREQEQLALNVVLEPQVRGFGLTRVETTLCVDYCHGGVSSGCTSECPGGHSCDATAFVYEATLDLDQRRLALELTTQEQVRIPMQSTDQCGTAFAQQPALAAPCSQRDKFEALWQGGSQ